MLPFLAGEVLRLTFGERSTMNAVGNRSSSGQAARHVSGRTFLAVALT